MKNILTYFLSPLVVISLLTSCGSKSTYEGFEVTDNGLNYKFFKKNDTAEKVEVGDVLYFSYQFFTMEKKDSMFINSKEVSRDGTGFVNFPVSKPSYKGSIEEGQLMMHKGDSAAFIISTDSFFLKTNQMKEIPKGFKPGTFIKAVFCVKDVIKKRQADSLQKIQKAQMEKELIKLKAQEAIEWKKYIDSLHITQKPDSNGIIYIEIKKGTGAIPKPTDVVNVHYKGTFLNGRVFDSSYERGQPVEFPLNGVIPGWTIGLQKMKVGGKAKLLIPSKLGYGEYGNQSIPPYAPLVFEIELLNISKAPAQLPETVNPKTK